MFQINKQGAVPVVSGNAPLNHETRDQFFRVASEQLKGAQPRLVVDLQQVPLLDSAGLESLLDLRDAFLAHGGSLQIAGAGPLCRDILVASGVAEHFALFDNLSAAVGSYS
jgi:anti-anti-sigma factor